MAATVAIKGTTTVIWGTIGILSDAGFANATIKDAPFEPIMERNKIGGNQGTTKTTITINDGRKGRITAVYDTAITWPASGAVVSVKERGVAGETAVLYEVVGEPRITRGNKKESEIAFDLEMHGDITLSLS